MILTGYIAKKMLKNILDGPYDDRKFKYMGPNVAGYYPILNGNGSRVSFYIAFDNTTGHCNVEEFQTEVAAKLWAERE